MRSITSTIADTGAAGSASGAAFVRNTWYVAAWSNEVSASPLARRILGVPVVLCRIGGRLAALEDRCCHRGLPLSAGRVEGEVLQCSYHGLCYDANGLCVKVPGQDRIPAGAAVRRYPTHEQQGMVWIWMGDAALADVSRIPAFPLHDDPNWLWRGATVHYAANHLFIYDNLLDLSHVGYVHKQTIGGNEAAHSNAEVALTRSEESLQVTRWMRGVVPPPTYLAVVPFKGLVDRWQVTRFMPGVIMISVGARNAGSGDGEDAEEGAYAAHSFQAVTPETSTSTHYFWSTGIDKRRHGPEMLELKFQQVSHTFEEDRVVIEAQFARRSEDMDRPLVDIRSDGPSLAARRILASLAERESGVSTAISGLGE